MIAPVGAESRRLSLAPGTTDRDTKITPPNSEYNIKIMWSSRPITGPGSLFLEYAQF